MKRSTLLFLPLLLVLAVFSSCQRDEDAPAGPDTAQLRSGTWTVDHVDVNYFSNGYLVDSDYIPFGENTEGGICTFHYDENTWTLDDNGTVTELSYRLEDNIIETAGGGTWGIRDISEDEMVLVLRGQESSNPCAYSSAGAVYTLTKNPATKQ